MDNSLGTGFVAVFAVSGSVVLLALQVHKRLLSDFMKKMENEIGTSKKNPARNKRVRFAKEADKMINAAGTRNSSNIVQAISSAGRSRVVEEKLETLPLNWQALYKGIIENKVLKGVY